MRCRATGRRRTDGRRGRRQRAEHDPRSPGIRAIAAGARDRQCIDRAIGHGRGVHRVGFGQCAEDHVDHAQDGFGVATNGCRLDGVDQRAIVDREVDDIEDAGVGGYVGKAMLERHVTGGDGRGTGNGHRACAGGRGAGEIEPQARRARGVTVIDYDPHGDPQRRIRDAIVV